MNSYTHKFLEFVLYLLFLAHQSTLGNDAR